MIASIIVISFITGFLIGRELNNDKFYRDYKSWLEYGSFKVSPVHNSRGEVVGWGASANEKMLKVMSENLRKELHPELGEK